MRPRTAKAAASWARHRTPAQPPAGGAGKSGEIYGEPPESGDGVVVWPSPLTNTWMVTSIPMYRALATGAKTSHDLSQGDLDAAIASAIARSRGVMPVYVICG